MQNKGSNKPYLILGQSGRMLARSAFEAGVPTVVIDQFGDVDTQLYAQACTTVKSFTDEAILNTADKMWQEYSCSGLVLASGFEARTDLIRELASRWPVLGNSPESVSAAKDPVILFDLLTQLDISYPQIQMEPPAEGEWLVKQQGSCGGDHISRFSKDKKYPPTHYYQRFQAGINCSAIFLANGDETQIIGYNQTWTEDKLSFRFGGAVTFNNFPNKKRLESIVNKFSQVLRLVGLCGVDFIVDDKGQVYILEINPRPVGTFDLHDNKSNNLFTAHLAACRGQLDKSSEISSAIGNNYFAKSIVYAKSDFEVPDLEWPDWVADIPENKQLIRKGEPLCTVCSEASDADMARNLVHNHHQEIENLIYEEP